MDAVRQLSVKEAFAALGESEALADAPFWQDGPPPSWACGALEPDNAIENALYCGVDEPGLEAVAETARRVQGSPALTVIARHLVWANFHRPDPAPPMPPSWPFFERELGAFGPSMYLLAGSAFVPLVKARHWDMGVPESITTDTCLQLACDLDNWRRGHTGQPGIYPNQFAWLRHYVFSPYFRLGRMEFWSKPFNWSSLVCRERSSGRTVAFASPGLNFDSANFALDAAATPPERVWTSKLERTEDFITGNPVDLDGRTSPETVTLSTRDWDVFLKDGDPILEMHIPAGGNMSFENVIKSFRLAKSFFERLMPDVRHKAVVCNSWIFNPNLPEMLPADSNLVKLVKSVRLCPTASGPTDGLWFIFLMDKFDLKTAPKTSSLQRAVISYLESGKRWRCGGMFVSLDEIH